MITDAKIRKLKVPPKSQLHPDKLPLGEGLQLHTFASGRKTFIFAYRFENKQKTLTIGNYPRISLVEAILLKDKARKILKQDKKDPKIFIQSKFEIEEKRYTFAEVTAYWLKLRESARDDEENQRKLDRDILPKIGNKYLTELPSDVILREVLRPLYDRKVIATAKKCLTIMNQIFNHAIAYGYASNNPILALRKTVPDDLAVLLKKIYDYDTIRKGSSITTAALKLSSMFFLRPTHIQYALWKEFDLEKGFMFIEADKTKTKEALIVPLPNQALKILKDLYTITGKSKYLFSGRGEVDRPISENTLNSALKRMGISGKHTVHGFRSTARTILDEVLEVRPDLIEHQLNHAVRDTNGRAYNRTKFLKQRKNMMQLWADYLDALRLDNDTSRFEPNYDQEQLLRSLTSVELDKLIGLIRQKNYQEGK